MGAQLGQVHARERPCRKKLPLPPGMVDKNANREKDKEWERSWAKCMRENGHVGRSCLFRRGWWTRTQIEKRTRNGSAAGPSACARTAMSEEAASSAGDGGQERK